MGFLTDTSPQAANRSTDGYAGGGSAVKSTEQTDAVKTMQRVMGDLARTIGANSGGAANKAHKIISQNEKGAAAYPDSDALQRAARAWGSTSAGGTSGSYDGIWGRNTKASLVAIQQFIQNAGISGVIVQPGNGSSPYREMEDVAITNMADQNIKNIGRLFESLGLASPESASAGNMSVEFDKISQQLSDDANKLNPWPEHIGDMTVRARDVSDLIQFVQFISRLSYTGCEPLPPAKTETRKRSSLSVEEAANTILKNTLFTFAQATAAEGKAMGEQVAASSTATSEREAERRQAEQAEGAAAASNPAAAAAKYQSEQQAKKRSEVDGPCWNSIDDFINWFKDRSYYVYDQLEKSLKQAGPHPIETNRLTTQEDVNKARAYNAAVQGLERVWGSYKKPVADIIRDQYDPNAPVVTPQILADAKKNGAGNTNAQTANRSGSGGSGREGGSAYTISGMEAGANTPGNGPIQAFMPLRNIGDRWELDRANASLDRLDEITGGRLPDINISEWRSSSWVSMAQRLEGENTAEKLRKFPAYASAVMQFIQDVYEDWRSIWNEELGSPDYEKLLINQDRNLSIWQGAINSQIGKSQRSMARTISKYEQLERTGPDDIRRR